MLYILCILYQTIYYPQWKLIYYLKLTNFNTKGFKQSYDYILDLLFNIDILCLSETWVRPHESNLIQNVIDDRFPGVFTVYSKCGMTDADSNYCGRPSGMGRLHVKCNRLRL